MSRTLTFEILRYDPNRPQIKPFMQTFHLEEQGGMTLQIALNRIRAEQDPSLRFDFVCRAGVCGSCGMTVNGILRLACRTLTADLFPFIRIKPMPYFKMLGDLSVDTGVWFRSLNRKLGAWIHSSRCFDPKEAERRVCPEDAARIYELERCIECGLCVAACATAAGRPDFLGAAGLHRMARFLLDPQDERSPERYYEILGTDAGAFGCFETFACADNCPLNLPLDDHMDLVRDLMARAEANMKP